MQKKGTIPRKITVLGLSLCITMVGFYFLGPNYDNSPIDSPPPSSNLGTSFLTTVSAQTPPPTEVSDANISSPSSMAQDEPNETDVNSIEDPFESLAALIEITESDDPLKTFERTPKKLSKNQYNLEALNLKNTEARFAIEAIARWTGKTVIPADQVLKERLTIISTKRLPQEQAIQQIYGALRVKGYVAEETDTTIFIRPLAEGGLGIVPTLSVEQPLAALENKEQRVQKFFQLHNYDPAQMMQILQPLVGEYGHISADQSSGTLLIIDTVANLLRIQNVIEQFDIPETETLETRVFELRYRPPQEIVTLLNTLLGDQGKPSKTKIPTMPQSRLPIKKSSKITKKTNSPATAISVGSQRQNMVLVSEPKFNWIIAKASPSLMTEIEAWIERLDKSLPTITADESLERIENKNQVVQRFINLSHYSPSRMASIVQPLLNESGYVSADESTGNLLIIDTVDQLIRVEQIITEFDKPEAENVITEIFKLRHSDPDKIIELLQALLSQDSTPSSSMVRHSSRSLSSFRAKSSRKGSSTSTVVRESGRTLVLIPERSQNWIIAKATPEDVNEISVWIEKLDTPVPTLAATDALEDLENRNQVVQKFVHLKHYPPSRMSAIIQPLLTPSGYVSADESTGNLLVIDTVEQLIRIQRIIEEFDQPETGRIVTEIFKLRHRAPDQIVELLEALLSPEIAQRANASRISNRSISKAYSEKRRSGSSTSLVVGETGRTLILIPETTQNWVIAKASPEDVNEIAVWIERLDTPVPTLTATDALEDLENRNQVVQKFVTLNYYSPSRMASIIQPLLNDSGYVSADESTGNLLIVDTVENLIRVERIITQFDRSDNENMVTEIFELRHRDPEQMVQLLETLIRDESNVQSRGMNSSRYTSRSQYSSSKSRYSRSGPSSTVVGQNGRSPILIPETTQNWVIAKATPDDINEIAVWIKRLDTPLPMLGANEALEDLENRNQVVQKFVTLEHYSPSRMAELLRPLMSTAGYVGSDDTTGNLLLVDTVSHLMRIEGVIAQFDIPESVATETRVFEIRHRKPEEVVTLLLSLFDDERAKQQRRSMNSSRYNSQRSWSSSRSRYSQSATSVTVGASERSVLLIPEPEQRWIIAKASKDDLDQVAQWIERLDCPTETVMTVDSLTDIEDPSQRVQRCIQLESYSPTQMAEIVLPLMNEDGYISADDNTRHLILIDSVENLLRIERLIQQFDIPEADQTNTRIFELQHSDPAEVTQMLRMLLGDSSIGSRGSYRPIRPQYLPRVTPYTSRLSRGQGLRAGTATSVLVGPTQMPIVLIPESERNWIIARASSEDLELLTEWITKIDQPQQGKRDYETISITYADVREVASRLTQAISQMPGTDLQASVLVQPLEQARQIILFGRAEMREMLKKIIEEVDMPPGQFETKHFDLAYAAPEQIKRSLDELFGDLAMASGRGGRGSFGRFSSTMSVDTVKTVAHTSLKQITVIASPENMLKVEEQIKLWDVALDVNSVEPQIIELFNSDPVQMTSLLSTLFSEESQGNNAWFDYLFGGSEDKRRIIGPLYGQLTFEEVPGTKKIVVISNIPEAYDVVKRLVRELDKQENAEVPRVISLKYADPETLAERLNAMFNEPGTSASIRLSERGLREYSMDDTDENGNMRQTGERMGDRSDTEYRPWWTTGRNAVGEMPISNVIGRARFIPDTHSKSLMVLAPPEFMPDIEAMIAELDIPGKQVMIKAIIAQVDHRDMSSLGIQLASHPSQFGDLDENSLVIQNALLQLERHGSLVFGAGGTSGSRFEGDFGMDISVMLDFLVKNLNAKILNQQTLWTKDNEEAEFFKGQRVPFQTRVSISDTGGRATSSYEYEKVGMTLRTRPSITPEKQVDMIINIVLSHLTNDEINDQPVRNEMDTTTNMIIEDGQTLMLGGMLFQEDTEILRKVPLLGDIPAIGKLFQHKKAVQANSELLVFITPFVIDEEKTSPEALQELEEARQKLDSIRSQLPTVSPALIDAKVEAKNSK